MPIQGYTPNRKLIQISSGSTDSWDTWYNQTLDLLDDPSIVYKITAAEDLSQGDVAAILDDGYGAKKAYLAASATYTFGDPMGIVTETITSGNPVHLTLAGRAQNNGWSFGASDKTVYLSASGTVTTTTTSVKIGYVLSSTAIYFDPGSSSSSGGQTDTVAGANGITNSGDNVDAILAPTYGSSANTVCQGNDSRLHNQNSDGATSNASFEINYAGNSARLLTTGLTANRDFTFPDATTKLLGESADGSITGDHDYSGGSLRVPTNAGVPSGANDEGDLVFDTTNDEFYIVLGGTSWQKLTGGAAAEASNVVINGLGEVNQRSDYTLVKDAYDFGPDRFEGMATGTTVSAGTLTLATGASVGRTGYAHHFSGVTLTGTGILYHRHRIDKHAARKLKNQSASLSVKVYHDIGSAKTFTLYIRKANSSDNFSAVTEISNDGGTSVDSATATELKFENVSMGDCSNGIEIEIKIETGAITTKNVYITEVQLGQGSASTDFEYRDYATELVMAQWYGWEAGTVLNGDLGTGFAISTTQCYISLKIPVTMRTTPTVTATNPGDFSVRHEGSITAATAVTSIGVIGPEGILLRVTVGSAVLTVGHGCALATSGSGSPSLFFGTEL